MSTKREQILAALLTTVSTVTGLSSAGASRSSVNALTREESPAIVIKPITDDPDASMIPVITWTMLVRIAIIVRGATPDSLADAIVTQVNDKIMQNKNFGGLAMDTEPAQVKFEEMAGDKPIGICNLGYIITYRTTRTDLTA